VENSYNQAKSSYQRAADIYHLINNPAAFLKETFVQRYPQAVKQLFRGRSTEDLNNFDSELGYGLYRYAFDHIGNAMARPSDPIVGTIQQEALNHLNTQFSNTFVQLNQFALAMHEFGRIPESPQAAPPSYVPETRACKVIGTC
jgi:hypothetical protein